MTPLERVAEAYWNSFRDGLIAKGIPPKDYPKWGASRDPVKDETLRCLRHAVETLRKDWDKPFDELFPEPPMVWRKVKSK